MDSSKVCEALQLTLQCDPDKKGENILNEMHKIIGFTPTLLKIIVEESVPAEVRQAASIYLKNNIAQNWPSHDDDSLCSSKENQLDTFVIHEDDKAVIRQNIVKAIVTVPLPLKVQLKACLETILQNDYPTKYQQFFDLVKEHLTGTDYNSLHGALLALHSFFQRYRYSQRDKWTNSDQALVILLPGLTQMMTRFMEDKSIESYTLQKLILKCFYAYSSFHLNPNTFNHEVAPVWINICCRILQDVNPEHDDDSEGIYWKNKKWAINFMSGIFSRFGNPGSVQECYNEFAAYFFKTFASQITELCVGLLLSKTYQSPRVKATALNFLTTALGKAATWKTIKPHFGNLLEHVLHPLLCHSDDDEELWEEDPNEYIRYRCVDIDSDQNPTMTAFALLESASAKRKGVLQLIMEFCMVVLNSSAASDKDKDGVLHIIGAISETLLKRKGYSNQLETFLVNFVFPTLQSPIRYRRGRACWLMSRLSDAKFHNNAVLCQAVNAVLELLMKDTEKPVQVFAAQALVKVCADQEKAQEVLKPHLAEILFKLINLLRETAFDEINELISDLIQIYCEEIIPIALNLINGLVSMVNNFVLKTSEDNTDTDDEMHNEETMLMLDSALTNIETILSACCDNQEILDKAEAEIIGCLKNILLKKCEDLYESAFTMFQMLQNNKISALQWQVFDWFYELYQQGFSEFFFNDSVHVLHRFITLNAQDFLSNPNRVSTTCEMLLGVFGANHEFSDEASKAGKLLECMVLEYREPMQPFIPKILESCITIYGKAEVTDEELKTICLQLISSCIFVSPESVLPILTSHPWPETDSPMLDRFLKLTIDNAKSLRGLHDRRLFVLMVCKIISLPAESRPTISDTVLTALMQQSLVLMEKLPSMYVLKASLEEDSDSEDEEDIGDESGDLQDNKSLSVEEGLESDEDAIDDASQDYYQYLASIEDKKHGDFEGAPDVPDEEEEDELTDLEIFETVLDKDEHDREEYVAFSQTMAWLEGNHAEFYAKMLGPMNDQQKKFLSSVAETARLTMEEKKSKKIEQAGGYDFKQTSVPTSFNFGGAQK